MQLYRLIVSGAATCLLALLIALSVSATTGAAEGQPKTITTDELKELFEQKRAFTLIDARTAAEYEDSHIVTAVNVEEKNFKSALPALPSDKGALLVTYCNGVKCGKSKKVAAKAQEAGYTNILVYGEGFPVWEEKGLPIVKGPRYDSTVKTLRIGAKDLEALLREKEGEYVLVDVREPKEFAAGHIAGAVNIPVGTFAAHSGGLPKEKGIIVYCNTGRRSAEAYRKLVKLGYPSILEATFVDWKNSGMPIAK